MSLGLFQDEIAAFRRLKSSSDFYYALGFGSAVSEIIAHVHDIRNMGLDRKKLVTSELETWRMASKFQLAAQDMYIGRNLSQSLNKADHSREVGSGVAFAYRDMCRAVGWDISDEELAYIEYRGHLHDAGRILNLGDKVLNAPIPNDEQERTPIQIAMPAAKMLFATFGKRLAGSEEEIAEAICFAAVSDRQGALFKAAVDVEPEVKSVIRKYFHQMDVHNPIFLRGFHSYSAHHDKVFGIGTDGTDKRGQFSNFSQHGAIDYLAILVDNISAAGGDAQSLDEIALWLMNEVKDSLAAQKRGEDVKLEPSYARYLLEDYGTGASVLENMFKKWVEEGYNRVPEGKVTMSRKPLVEALRNLSNEDIDALNNSGTNPYPQLIGWSSLSKDPEARRALADDLSKVKWSSYPVATYIRNEAAKLPQLTQKRVRDDLKVVQSEALIYTLTFQNYRERFMSLTAMASNAVAFWYRGGAAQPRLVTQ